MNLMMLTVNLSRKRRLSFISDVKVHLLGFVLIATIYDIILSVQIRAQTQEVKLGVKEVAQQLAQSQEVVRRLNKEII